MDWHRLTLDEEPDPADAMAALVEFVRREYEKAGSPAGFRVLQDAGNAGTPVFFFSPEACVACPELPYFNAAPCPPPPHPESLSRIV
jgi:hypothetical protein